MADKTRRITATLPKQRADKHRAVVGWGVRHWTGGLYIDTIRRTRAEAVVAFKEAFGVSDKDWTLDARYGVHRCVPVTIVPGRPAPAGKEEG